MRENELRVYTLFSGSSGNSLYVSCGGYSLLIDAGMSYKAICSALCEIGASVSEIEAVFVTHEHGDHIKGLEVLSKKTDIPIHIVKQSYDASRLENGRPESFILHQPVFEENVGPMKISSFVTPHDSEMSVGYVIDTPYGKIALATDMGYMTKGVYEQIRQCKYVVLESNYDEGMLVRGPYPKALKKRIYSDFGHLSNDACAETAYHLASGCTEKILLAHLSKENNTPELALNCTVNKLKEGGFNNVEIIVADRSEPTELLCI